MEELIKFLLAIIGFMTLVGLVVMWVYGKSFNSETISMCVDQYNTIEYKIVEGETYCQVGEYKWFKLNKK